MLSAYLVTSSPSSRQKKWRCYCYLLQVTSYKSHTVTHRELLSLSLCHKKLDCSAGPKKTIICLNLSVSVSVSNFNMWHETCNANDATPFLLASSSLLQVDRQRFRCGSCQPTPCAHAGHVVTFCASNAQCETTGPTILHLADPSWQRYVGQVAGFSMNSTLRHKVKQQSPVQSNRPKMITQDTATTATDKSQRVSASVSQNLFRHHKWCRILFHQPYAYYLSTF